MKVTISVGGRFHAFNLANQLNKKECLQLLITSYPSFKVSEYGVPGNKVESIIIKEILERSWRKLPSSIQKLYDAQFPISNIFDFLASRKIRDPDIFVGWASKALKSIKKAKEKGALTIVERGSSHVVYQDSILREEYSKYGNKVLPNNEKIINKELKEYEQADYISVPSDFVKNTFKMKGVPGEKIIHVPYGVDLSHFRQIKKKDNVFRIIFAGGMKLRKGVHYLLKGFSELNLPNSELVLLGSITEEIKPFFDKYNVKSSKELGDGAEEILYLGHKPQNELYRYYSQGSVFTIMSIEEGLAMVQPQAMACGLPVVCTTNTGGGDIVRDGKDGFVIPIRDVEILKEKLTYLYDNTEKCREMGKSARNRVSSGFTWDDYGNKIVSEYKRILSERDN